jgi:hypothetical protein
MLFDLTGNKKSSGPISGLMRPRPLENFGYDTSKLSVTSKNSVISVISFFGNLNIPRRPYKRILKIDVLYFYNREELSTIMGFHLEISMFD